MHEGSKKLIAESAEELAIAQQSKHDKACESQTLSRSETKEIVTPYAFTVSHELLGKPLATPSRRALAILIDVFLISVLSTISAFIFAVFVALTFFRADAKLKQNALINNKNAWYYTRLLLRSSGAVIVFLTAFYMVQSFNEDKAFDVTTGEEVGLLIAEKLIIADCEEDLVCLQEKGSELAKGLAGSAISEQAFTQGMEGSLAGTSWSEVDINQTLALYQEAFSEERAYLASLADDESPLTENVSQAPEEAKAEVLPSLLEWGEAIMSELGLGLGWAALYFSVFTAWANGQTIGKRLCRIKVVKLDGNAPNLWESFGRYGGYGAGFATGLLGFLQLYWDPNRQAIQDKISETLVLRIEKSKKSVKTCPEGLNVEIETGAKDSPLKETSQN